MASSSQLFMRITACPFAPSGQLKEKTKKEKEERVCTVLEPLSPTKPGSHDGLHAQHDLVVQSLQRVVALDAHPEHTRLQFAKNKNK
jgi:hypothetical protein